MERDPAIHITLSNFKMILKSLGLENADTLSNRIFKAAVPYNIKDRYIIAGDAEVRKQARRVVAASASTGVSPERFNRLLTTLRTQAGHRGVVHLRISDTSNWMLLKEVTQLSNEFAESHGLDAEEAAGHFIKLGIKLMKRQYSLGKFKYYREKINSLYIAADMVENDPKHKQTKECYTIWRELMQKYGKFIYDLKDYEQFVIMVYVRMEADAVGASYRDWLAAQFEFFTVFQTVPTLNQLVTDAALQRYYDYMTKKRGNKKAIRNDKTDYKSEFDQKYFEAVRHKIEPES